MAGLIASILLLSLTIVARLAPRSELGGAILTFIARPVARRLSRIHRGHLVVATSLLLVAALLIHALGGDAPIFVSMGASDVASMLAAMDAATLADALVGVLLVAGVARLAPVRAWFAVRRSKSVGHVRHRRTSRGRRAMPRPDNDDSEDRRYGLAIAA